MSSERPGSIVLNGLMFVLLLLAALWLRFDGITAQLLLDDEWHALNMVQNHDYTVIFSRFGTADHSIPLTLWYEFVSRHGLLTEMAMRWPSLVAGVLLVALLPLMWLQWMSPPQQWLFMALLAIAPLLVFFSRFARPYALLALLLSISLLFAWWWWHERRTVTGIAWLASAVLAAWLNPLSMCIGLAPFVWFFGQAVGAGLKGQGWDSLRRLVVVGFVAAAAIVLLLAAPVSNDWTSLASKSGQDHLGMDTLWAVAAFFTGTGLLWVTLVMCAAAVYGWLLLRSRARDFAHYLLVVAVLALLTVATTGAAWIHQAIVPARYLIGLLPVFLALVSIGVVSALQKMLTVAGTGYRDGLLAVLLMGLALGLWRTGPLPHWQLGGSALSHHAANYFDLRREQNPFIRFLDDYRPAPFYAEIAQRHPQGDAVVVEAPWYFESSLNPLHLHQAIHGQALKVGFVNGLCAGPLRGEVRRDANGIALRNAVFLQDLPAALDAPFYLVLQRHGLANESPHTMNYSRCANAMRKSLGKPWRRTEDALVFSWPPGDAATTSQ